MDISQSGKLTRKSTRTENSGLFASLHLSPLFIVCYFGVSSQDGSFFVKITVSSEAFDITMLSFNILS